MWLPVPYIGYRSSWVGYVSSAVAQGELSTGGGGGVADVGWVYERSVWRLDIYMKGETRAVMEPMKGFSKAVLLRTLWHHNPTPLPTEQSCILLRNYLHPQIFSTPTPLPCLQRPRTAYACTCTTRNPSPA
ncbi:hypothetical protein CC80DRAFT_24395 [Byssothecium circinans]|uniref:Uncharacterized protein n=1 Tax=Byssothecium circinans TaxID=147558 RepID=A0A6A5T859_9PLEO|nr:hypothetical protein CC80DRAFT_317777 [Byssothecium circinans]KAF1959024.1 hypothetical protein CC80DRAFT_24395 [Byssothecium circinans]